VNIYHSYNVALRRINSGRIPADLFVAPSVAWHRRLLWPAAPARLGNHKSVRFHLSAVAVFGFGSAWTLRSSRRRHSL